MTNDVLKAALAVTQGLMDTPLPSAAYRRRTAEHIAEVQRLAGEHAAMNAGIDRYQDSRAGGYDDKVNEVFVDTRAALGSEIATSQGPAKQT